MSKPVGAELLLIGIPINSSMKDEAADFINTYCAYMNSESNTSAYDNLITSDQKVRHFRPKINERMDEKEARYYRLLSESEPRDIAPRLEFTLHDVLDLYMKSNTLLMN